MTLTVQERRVLIAALREFWTPGLPDIVRDIRSAGVDRGIAYRLWSQLEREQAIAEQAPYVLDPLEPATP